ncbi:uncharacterized protein LOC108915673 isoform X2 [Anoplophora glabripennis]|nr:uncharacterized protein LOC108915673 isoform X2 [Anoplophora glabripennis]XP_018577304.1 uncharacterized protein LOC108915673 isoform X2 [Anoplophora glabripennis]XP_018577314.1 uncharacterized protein LOC108915673 isoform X2 [Anoplophora glabripennis]
MGKPVENEVVLRSRAKEVRALIIENQDIDKAIEIIKENEAILTFDFGRNKYLSLLPTIRLEKGLKNKYYCLEKVIQAAVQIYVQNENYEELAFLAAASCDVDNLHLAMTYILPECRSKTREGDTILLFFIKFANLKNSKYIDTLKILVNKYKLSVNKADYKDHSPITILLNKYDSLQQKGITQYNDVILNAASVILTRHNVDVELHKLNGKSATDIIKLYDLHDTLKKLQEKNKDFPRINSAIEDEENILFSFLTQKKENDFLITIKEVKKNNKNIVDVEDGNNTLLQLACEKNLKEVVAYLIQEEANLSKTTNRNRKTPLEIAARRNFNEIFKELLKTNKIVIDLNLFTVFLLNRGRQIKTKYFNEILCYDGLQVDIVYKNGNTPLHYAIIFDNTKAILKLLDRGASLFIQNYTNKTPLDYISKDDLELYLDQCLVLDNYNTPHSKKYEIRFDFSGLLQKDPNQELICSEVEIMSKICSCEKFKGLATHPLISAFLETKWNVTAPTYNKILAIYGFVFVYYFLIAIFVGHITFLFLLTISVLIFFTLQPPINLKNKECYFTFLFYASFTFLVYYLIKNEHIRTCILTVTLLYQFLRQHLYFSKYQAVMVNGIRKITPHVIALFGIYCVSNFKDFLENSKIIFPITIYMLLITYSFNALFDSVGDVEHSFKTLYNRDTLHFIKFTEYMYCRFNILLSSPFIRQHLKTSTESKNSKKNKFYLNFYLNKNKFVNENFHFLKLDAVTQKSLQDFVNRVSTKINQME